MNNRDKSLQEAILDFMSVINSCLTETTYAKDRVSYQKDLAYAASWLIRLHSHKDEALVIQDILDTATSKFFYDVYKQGKWGDNEAKAFKELQNLAIQLK